MRAQRMESIGTLAGGIAHDLNNILAPIMMSIEMLKEMSERSAEPQKILETIEVSARRGADIVRQVLSFARGMEGERVEIQPKHLLKDIENDHQGHLPEGHPAATSSSRRHLDHPGRSHAGAPGAAQSLRQRAGRDAQRRHAEHRGGELRARRALRRHESPGQAGPVREDQRDRFGHGHPAETCSTRFSSPSSPPRN